MVIAVVCPESGVPSQPTAAAAALGERMRASWRQVRGHRRGGVLAAVGPGLAAIAAVLGLLTGFQQVVHGAVERGDLWRKAVALQADAALRCRLVPDADLRQEEHACS